MFPLECQILSLAAVTTHSLLHIRLVLQEERSKQSFAEKGQIGCDL